MPRGRAVPRYCAVCGQHFPSPAVAVRHRFKGAANVPMTAFASLVLGITALVPILGWPLGVAAIVLGVSAHRKIARSQGRLGGAGVATAGIVFGGISCVLHSMVCL